MGDYNVLIFIVFNLFYLEHKKYVNKQVKFLTHEHNNKLEYSAATQCIKTKP